MAEVAFRELSDRCELANGRHLGDLLEVSSAGTANWHVDSDMDPRARAALDAAGFFAEGSPAAHVSAAQLAATDLAVALDRGHLADLRKLATPRTEVALLLSWGGSPEIQEVADPYYGTDEGFEATLATIVMACEALAVDLAARLA